MTTAQTKGSIARVTRWLEAVVLLMLIYLLSSGPVMAGAFWLREKTHWDGFYAVMWLYFPLLGFGHWEPLETYIGWWCKAFHTVGPG